MVGPQSKDQLCPVGSAPRSDPMGSCVCLPSLCPSAYLPFTCPFGARVLRRASRIPGDCCDQYECASPPMVPQLTPDHDDSMEASAPSPASSGAPSEETGAPAKKPPASGPPSGLECPKDGEGGDGGSTSAPGRTVVGCDIVGGRACRCTRLPACRPQGPGKGRKRRRRKGGGDRDDQPYSPFTFATLEECKEQLSQQLRRAEAVDGDYDDDEEDEGDYSEDESPE
ncbi:uncharacterized protein [Hetaerina americana]|uniref:uncharacterized protein n=1 Tax=Hetaerina americana TaxID=62018 RepID=UPI003A7F20AA